MWSDNESDVDLLGFDYLVTAITSIIGNEALLPATIGVYGDWGSGKSSLLKRTQVELEKEKDVLVLSFTGWLFEGYEDAKTALMGTILDEIVAKRTLDSKAKHLVGNLLKRINVMQVLGSITKFGVKAGLAYVTGGATELLSGAVGAAEVAGKLAEKAKEVDVDEIEIEKFLREDPHQNLRRGIREFRKDFEQLLKETKIKTLVVVIDDLDRCNPDTIIETLEAIKLFLFVPHTAFILGADERLVKYAVRRRFPELPGERAEVGRDYLEKLIQFDIRIPSLGRPELETYINLLFFEKTNHRSSEAFKKAQEHISQVAAQSFLDVRFNYGIAKSILEDNVPEELAEDLIIAQRIAPILLVGLNGNPRQCKRFLNKLMIRVEMAKSKKVELKQLAKLMLLEYFSPQFFKELAELQAAQQGHPKEMGMIERIINPPKPIEIIDNTQAKDADNSRDTELKEKKRSSVRAKVSDGAVGGNSDNSVRQSSVQLPQPVSMWISDSWMKDWLKSQPSLADEDLQPYFFFSRDTLQGALNTALQRMTPHAQEMLSKLLQESEAVRNSALKKAGELSLGDAAAVFQALTEKVREEEDLGDELSAFNRLYDWVNSRPELFNQFVAFVRELPEMLLPPTIALRLEKLGKEREAIELVKELFQQWNASPGSSPVKAAARKRLENL
jgi:KAP family P-loop domain